MKVEKLKIGIAWGGYSSERLISKMSCDSIYGILKKKYLNLYKIEFSKKQWIVSDYNDKKFIINKNDFSFIKNGLKINFDFVINMIHGSPGEDGKLADYLENLAIPHSSSNSTSSKVAFNKNECLSFAKKLKIPTAKSLKIDLNKPYDISKICSKIGLPCFVKANSSGSSFGISKVIVKQNLKQSILMAFKESDEVLIEANISGKEYTVGITNWNGKIKVLPITEIIPENDFFDYNSKYKGKSVEVTPASTLSKICKNKLEKMTVKLYKNLKLFGLCRADFIVKDEIPYFLEINTVPGMTEKSIIPQQLIKDGISINNYYNFLIKKIK